MLRNSVYCVIFNVRHIGVRSAVLAGMSVLDNLEDFSNVQSHGGSTRDLSVYP